MFLSFLLCFPLFFSLGVDAYSLSLRILQYYWAYLLEGILSEAERSQYVELTVSVKTTAYGNFNSQCSPPTAFDAPLSPNDAAVVRDDPSATTHTSATTDVTSTGPLSLDDALVVPSGAALVNGRVLLFADPVVLAADPDPDALADESQIVAL